jgi:membrane-bound inhibitor of C-type lysozyme
MRAPGMRPFAFPSRPPRAALGAVAAAVLALAACSNAPTKEEQEAAKNTFACRWTGERLVLRFDTGEVRLLMPDGERITLYQIPAPAGVRYSNGTLELRGKGMDLQLVRDGVATPLADCEPYQPPK